MTAAPGHTEPGLASSARTLGAPLLAILVVAVVVRTIALDQQLWLDEILMLHDFVRQPIATTLTSYPSDNQHPLYSLMASLSARALGETPVALRLPAVIFGVLSIGAAAAFALRRTGSRGIALTVSALLAVSHHHVWFSQNARGYTALMFFTILAVDAFIDVRSGLRGAPLRFAVTLGLASWVHLTAVFIGIGCALIAATDLLRHRGGTRPAIVGLVGSALVALLLHAPMLSAMWEFFRPHAVVVGATSTWKSPLWTLGETLRGLGSGTVLFGATVAAAGLVTGLFGMRAVARRHGVATVALMVLPALVGAVVTILLGRHLWPRFFFNIAAFAILFGVAGLWSIVAVFAARAGYAENARGPRAVRAGLATLLLAASAATVPSAWQPKQDFVGARDLVHALAAPGDTTVTVGLATWPYSYLVEPAFRPVETIADMRNALAAPANRWLVYASKAFCEGFRPDVWSLTVANFDEVKTFPSTVGEVVVCRRKAP